MANIKLDDLRKVTEQTIKSLKGFLSIYDKTISRLKRDSEVIKNNLSAVGKTTAKGLAAQNKALAETEKLVKEREATDQKRKKTLSDLEKLQQQEAKIIKQATLLKTEQGKATEKARLELQKTRKEVKDNIKANTQLTNAFQKLSQKTNEAQAEFKRLAAEFGVNSKQAQKALVKFNKLDNSLRMVNNAARDGRRDVGRYGLALGNLAGNLVGALGVVGGLQLFVQITRAAFNVVREFSAAQSELAAILGVTKSEISDLTDLTLQLGSTTAFTAAEVTKAATELAKLGLTTDQIQLSLKGVLDGALALGAEIPETAKLVASTLKAFNLEASESERVVSTLAVATTKSSLDFAKLETALGNVAPAAAAFGASVEETTALLGLITDKGIDASTAGTQLRNIFIQLKADGLTLDQALNKIGTSQDKLSAANEIFGKRAAVTAIALADQRNNIESATKAITDQDEALKQLIETRLDNLDGDLKILTSAWEGFILSFEKGDGVISSVFRAAVQLTTVLINSFTKANQIISVFLTRLGKELKPVTDLIQRLFSSFGDFNFQGALTETIIKRIVIGFKLMVAPLRLIVQWVILLKNAFTELGTGFGNFFKQVKNAISGESFDFSNIFNFSKLEKDLAKIKDIVIDTFTVDDIPEPKLPKAVDAVITGGSGTSGTGVGGSGTGATGFEGGQSSIVRDNTLLKQQLILQQELLEGKITEQEFNILNQQIIQDQLKIDVQRLELQALYETDLAKRSELEAEILKKKREILDIEKQSNDAITDNLESEKAVNDTLKDREKEIRELTEESLNLISKITDSLFDKRKQQLDEELQISLSNQEKLNQAKQAGSEDAKASLAEEERRQREVEARQVKLEKRRLQTEAAIALLNAYSENGSIGETVSALAVIQSAVGGLQGFYEGTDSVGSTGSEVKFSNGRDGYLAKLDKGEKVLTRDENQRLASYGIHTRDDIFDLAERTNMSINQGGKLVVAGMSTDAMESKLDKVCKAVENIEMNVSFNINKDYVVETRAREKRIEKLKMTANGWNSHNKR